MYQKIVMGLTAMMLAAPLVVASGYPLPARAVQQSGSNISPSICEDPLYKREGASCVCRWPPLSYSRTIEGVESQDVCALVRSFVPLGSSTSGSGVRAALGPVVNFVAVRLTGFIIMIGLIVLVFGGYLYMVSGGSADRVHRAKGWIIAALLGIVIAVTAVTVLLLINPSTTRF